ncbi:MAG: hypothetical protein ACFCD0_25815 [Gemmataceae bacterium]
MRTRSNGSLTKKSRVRLRLEQVGNKWDTHRRDVDRRDVDRVGGTTLVNY